MNFPCLLEAASARTSMIVLFNTSICDSLLILCRGRLVIGLYSVVHAAPHLSGKNWPSWRKIYSDSYCPEKARMKSGYPIGWGDEAWLIWCMIMYSTWSIWFQLIWVDGWSYGGGFTNSWGFLDFDMLCPTHIYIYYDGRRMFSQESRSKIDWISLMSLWCLVNRLERQWWPAWHANAPAQGLHPMPTW